MLEPHSKLDIDWDDFNKRLDNVDGVERKPAPHITLRQMIADGEKYYNTVNCAHHCYTNDNFHEWLPKDFLSAEGYDGQVLIRVIELPPASFTEPHVDAYTQSRKKYRWVDRTIKRLWIPCADYKMGHALFMGDDQVVTNYNAGDCFDITPWQNTLHSGVNAGVELRRTMTITGTIDGS